MMMGYLCFATPWCWSEGNLMNFKKWTHTTTTTVTATTISFNMPHKSHEFTSGKQGGHNMLLIIPSQKTLSTQHTELILVWDVALSCSKKA